VSTNERSSTGKSDGWYLCGAGVGVGEWVDVGGWEENARRKTYRGVADQSVQNKEETYEGRL
jgi:hypothetical protein